MAKGKQGLDIIGRDGGRVGQGATERTFDVSLLGREDVPHQFTNVADAAITVRPQAHSEGGRALFTEPRLPLGAVPVRVGQQVIEAEHEGHVASSEACEDAPTTCASAAGPRRVRFSMCEDGRWCQPYTTHGRALPAACGC